MLDEQLHTLAERIAEAACYHRLMLASAESCTGGWAAEVLTSVPGSSEWFERGFVTYSNLSKQECLGVGSSIIETYGAVSEQTALQMAEGVIKHSHAQISFAITGIAGPRGGVAEKPVGTICLAWAGVGMPTRMSTAHFKGDRQDIRRQAVLVALQGVLDVLKSWT